MKYDLPAAELYYRSRRGGEKYKDLGKKFGCSGTTISRRVRAFEALIIAGDPEATTELERARRAILLIEIENPAENSPYFSPEGEPKFPYIGTEERDPWYIRLWDWFRGRISN